MKQLILLVGAICISASSFAGISSSNQPSSLKALGSVWRTHPSIKAGQEKNDLTIVYGGADISRKPTLISHMTTA